MIFEISVLYINIVSAVREDPQQGLSTRYDSRNTSEHSTLHYSNTVSFYTAQYSISTSITNNKEHKEDI